MFDEKEERDLFRAMTGVKSEEWRLKTLKNWRDCAFTQPIGAGQLEHGGNNFLQFMRFGENAKSVMKSRFFCDFTRFHPFLIFQTIQHAKHVLTRKIVRFYEWKRDFNNLEAFQVNTYHFRWREWRALEWKKNLSVKTY